MELHKSVSFDQDDMYVLNNDDANHVVRVHVFVIYY